MSEAIKGKVGVDPTPGGKGSKRRCVKKCAKKERES